MTDARIARLLAENPTFYEATIHVVIEPSEVGLTAWDDGGRHIVVDPSQIVAVVSPTPPTEVRIKCARCGRPMIAQTDDATIENNAMEVCSECSWQIASENAWDEGHRVGQQYERESETTQDGETGAHAYHYAIDTNPYRVVKP